MIWLPAPEVVLRLHQKMIDSSGGSHGIRDMGLIESAVARASAAWHRITASSTTTSASAWP